MAGDVLTETRATIAAFERDFAANRARIERDRAERQARRPEPLPVPSSDPEQLTSVTVPCPECGRVDGVGESERDGRRTILVVCQEHGTYEWTWEGKMIGRVESA